MLRGFVGSLLTPGPTFAASWRLRGESSTAAEARTLVHVQPPARQCTATGADKPASNVRALPRLRRAGKRFTRVATVAREEVVYLLNNALAYAQLERASLRHVYCTTSVGHSSISATGRGVRRRHAQNGRVCAATWTRVLTCTLGPSARSSPARC